MNKIGKDRTLKKTIVGDELRHERQKVTIELRKVKREEALTKRRRHVLSDTQVLSTTMCEVNADVSSQLACLTEYVAQVTQVNSESVCLTGLQSIHRLLNTQTPPIQAVFDSGVVPRLVELLGQPDLQNTTRSELTECVHFLSFGTRAQSMALVKLGVLSLMIPYLRNSEDRGMQTATLMLYGNIASENATLRDAVLSEGVLQIVLSLAQDPKIWQSALMIDLSWILWTFNMHMPKPNWAIISQVLPCLAQMLQHPDPIVVSNATSSFNLLTEDKSDDQFRIEAVYRLGVLPRLVHLFQHPLKHGRSRNYAVKVLANMVSGKDTHVDAVLQCNIFLEDTLLCLLERGDSSLRVTVAAMLANIAAHSEQALQQVIMAKFVPVTVAHLQQTDDHALQKELCFFLANVLGLGNDEQVRYSVDHKVLQSLFNILSGQDLEVKVAVIQSVERVLKFGALHQERRGLATNPYADIIVSCHGDGVLEHMQLETEDREDLYDQLQVMLRTYFNTEEHDFDDLAVEAQRALDEMESSNSSTFSFTSAASSTTSSVVATCNTFGTPGGQHEWSFDNSSSSTTTGSDIASSFRHSSSSFSTDPQFARPSGADVDM